MTNRYTWDRSSKARVYASRAAAETAAASLPDGQIVVVNGSDLTGAVDSGAVTWTPNVYASEAAAETAAASLPDGTIVLVSGTAQVGSVTTNVVTWNTGAAAWTPSTPGNLVLDWDPDDASNYTLVDSKVSEFRGAVGAGDVGSQSGAGNRPTITANAVGGLDALTFTTTSWLDLPSEALVPAGESVAPLTVVALVSIASSATWRYGAAIGDGGMRMAWLLQNNKNQIWGLSQATPTVPTDGTPTILSAVLTPSDLAYVQGNEDWSTTESNSASPNTLGGADTFRRIGASPSGTLGFNGHIARLLIYRGALGHKDLGEAMRYMDGLMS